MRETESSSQPPQTPDDTGHSLVWLAAGFLSLPLELHSMFFSLHPSLSVIVMLFALQEFKEYEKHKPTKTKENNHVYGDFICITRLTDEYSIANRLLKVTVQCQM